MHNWDFEKPIIELENKIEELRKFSTDKGIDLSAEIKNLEVKLKEVKRGVYSSLTPWQKVQISRHSKRPTTLDYITLLMQNFMPLHGDRLYGDDKALVCGLATLEKHKIVILGHQKGKDTKENLLRSFGCAHPEGYRKSMRVMRLGERFGLPIVCFIDTPGAYPGVGAEERGQAQAIAENIRDMFSLRVPVIVVVIGEGGSGGALGIGVGDRVYVMEYAYYSVISPEGCAAILWKDASRREDAGKVLKLTAPDLLKLEVINGIVPEPEGGAHRDHKQAAAKLKQVLVKALDETAAIDADTLVASRYSRFRKMGVVIE